MEPILVPGPPKQAFNKQRRMSDLIKAQVKHFKHLEAKLPADLRRTLPQHQIVTEDDAARYIAPITKILLERGRIALVPPIAKPKAAPIPIRPSPELSIAAAAETSEAARPEGILMRALLVLAALLFVGSSRVHAQNPNSDKNRLQRDFRNEGEELAACKKFSFGNLISCGQTLVTGQPLHISVGSLAPQDGTGFGLAFVEHKHFANELITNFDIDAEASPNGSWRAGGYIKAYRLPGGLVYRTAPLFNLYSQSISLKRVDYYGLGSNTPPAAHTTYGFSENITGLDAIIPLRPFHHAGFALVGELNGRFPSVRPGSESNLLSINQLFTESTAPGLSRQPAYIQGGEGIRITPALFKDRIRLNYLVQFQQFIAPGNSGYSFRRFNADFNHEIPLYKVLPGRLGQAYFGNRATIFPPNGPDDCTSSNQSRNVSQRHIQQLAADDAAAAAAGKPHPARPCPVISTTEKLEGSITLRAYLSQSIASAGNAVPFYFMPTIGGSDINGTPVLASYPDYRFRGPDLVLFRGSIEHSIGKLPLGWRLFRG